MNTHASKYKWIGAILVALLAIGLTAFYFKANLKNYVVVYKLKARASQLGKNDEPYSQLHAGAATCLLHPGDYGGMMEDLRHRGWTVSTPDADGKITAKASDHSPITLQTIPGPYKTIDFCEVTVQGIGTEKAREEFNAIMRENGDSFIDSKGYLDGCYDWHYDATRQNWGNVLYVTVSSGSQTTCKSEDHALLSFEALTITLHNQDD